MNLHALEGTLRRVNEGEWRVDTVWVPTWRCPGSSTLPEREGLRVENVDDPDPDFTSKVVMSRDRMTPASDFGES